jgi:hypothetical protein
MTSATPLSLLSITNGAMQSHVDILRLWVRLLEAGVADHFDAAVLFFKELAPKLTGLRCFLAHSRKSFPRPTTQINRLGVESTLMDTFRDSRCLANGRQYFCGHLSPTACRGVCNVLDRCQCVACRQLSTAALGTADELLDLLWAFWSNLAPPCAANLSAATDFELAVVSYAFLCRCCLVG